MPIKSPPPSTSSWPGTPHIPPPYDPRRFFRVRVLIWPEGWGGVSLKEDTELDMGVVAEVTSREYDVWSGLKLFIDSRHLPPLHKHKELLLATIPAVTLNYAKHTLLYEQYSVLKITNFFIGTNKQCYQINSFKKRMLKLKIWTVENSRRKWLGILESR